MTSNLFGMMSEITTMPTLTDRIPTKEECLSILKTNGTPEHVIRHCLAVSNASRLIGIALSETGVSLDTELITSAALLHDIARTEKDHARVGAELLRKQGFERIASIVSQHMEHKFPDSLADVTELDAVCLGDRVVRENICVGFEKRMEDVFARFAHQPNAIAKITANIERSRAFIRAVEERVCRSMDEICGATVPKTDTLLLSVEKPGRYVGGEQNAVYKNPSTVSLRFGLAFPDMYEIAMSWMGMQVLYHMLNERPQIWCERVFAPAPDMAAVMKKNRLSLFALESGHPVKQLDILGFTLQFELSFTNVVHMLNQAGLAVRSADRDETDPLIIAGGPCAFNPEPLAEVFDLVAIGDGEEVLPELCELFIRMKNGGGQGGKKAFLKEASLLEGVYIPSFYEPRYAESGEFLGLKRTETDAPPRIKKSVVSDLCKAFIPLNPIVPLIETVHNRAAVEIFRGCTRGCRFCQAGMLYRPVRERTQSMIQNSVEAQLANTGYDEVSLLSLSTGDYSGVDVLVMRLMEYCARENVSLSVPSLRLDSFSFGILRELQKYKKSGLTFAPEAGSQRLRNVINKTITEEEIMTAVREAVSLGWNHIKFYFMVGLPTETQDDIDAIVSVSKCAVQTARSMQKKGNRMFTLSVSVSNFVPKPHTPFQWVAQDSQELLHEKNMYLKTQLNRIKGVSFRFHDTRGSHIEALLARGDRRMLSVITRAAELGCRFDSWSEHFRYELWMQAFADAGVSAEAAAFPIDGALPWEHISPGVHRAYLISEWERARCEYVTRDCREGCTGCGLNCRKDDSAGEYFIRAGGPV
ncbi:MAG: TIGR03960 family B12-binding radical SAM protein [Clostridiales Family XIII bacterium]|nr:TIGR03960 family B12-binding radical SAM protein [Clostridiales Family XIII bacterium]